MSQTNPTSKQHTGEEYLDMYKDELCSIIAERDKEIESLTWGINQCSAIAAEHATSLDKLRSALARIASGNADANAAQFIAREALSDEPTSPSETSGWQPIETAPDPQITPVLGAVLREAGDYAVGEMHQTEVGWYWAGNDPSDSWGGQIYPAYWQPLPKPPGSAVKATAYPHNPPDGCLDCLRVERSAH